MGYSTADLIVFQILRDKACWLDGSVFIAGFDFFVKCFENANPKFDYFAFEVFDTNSLDRLDRALAEFHGALTPGCSREAVFSRNASLFEGDIWEAIDTEPLRAAIAGAGRELREFIGQVRGDGKRLWVMGM